MIVTHGVMFYNHSREFMHDVRPGTDQYKIDFSLKYTVGKSFQNSPGTMFRIFFNI